MAITVVFDGTRIDDAEALSPGGGNVWLDTTGKAANIEPDFVYQNTNCVSEKVGTTELGIGLDTSGGTPASFDMTTPKVLIAKVIATNSSVLNVKGSTGGKIEIGSGGLRTNYDQYYVVGGDTYPIKGGWLIIPVDPNGGNQSNRPGTAPTLTTIDYFGWVCDFTGTSKSTNVGMDAVDIVPNGSGLTLTGNTPDGTFANFVTTDEGTATNRWGIVSTQDSILFVTGVLTIGTATETDFTDANAVIVFPDAEFLNTVGFFGLNIGLQNASSVIAITSCTFKGNGSSGGTVDTRPDYLVTGTSGALTYASCAFDTFRVMTLTAGATLTDCIFLGGELVTMAGATISGGVFSGGTGTHYILTTNPTLLTGCGFTQGASGHAVRCDTVGTYSWTDITDSGYTGTRGSNLTSSDGSTDAMFYNNSGGLITLNVSGGSSGGPSVRNGAGATTVVNASVEVTFTGMKDLTEVRVYAAGTTTELDGIENATAGTTDDRSFVATVGAGVSVDYTLVNVLYEIIRVEAFSWPATNQDLAVQQRFDRNNFNPA